MPQPPPSVCTRSVTSVALPTHGDGGGCCRVLLSPFDAYWVALLLVRPHHHSETLSTHSGTPSRRCSRRSTASPVRWSTRRRRRRRRRRGRCPSSWRPAAAWHSWRPRRSWHRWCARRGG
ncbi:Os01g0169600 [Oryza sativa Japonica Group]|uniref:Os01g0169600 protein n=1 Tax=Oryza sativa subsp. japonica TaxID=39947 RepID=A0A0P0UYJ4_ORYSJ|nr:Os01g0169600 [Oryza sativa Japonica Group]